MSLYDELGVTPDATEAEIKKAHRRRVKETHPDAGGDRAAFERVQRALTVLTNPEARARYDQTGQEEDLEPEGLTHAQARTAVAAKMMQLIASEAVDPRYYDLVTGIREMIDNDIRGVQERISAITRMQERMRKFAARLTHKGDSPERLIAMLEAEIANGAGMVTGLNRQIQMYTAAKELAAEYVYKTDKPEPYARMGGGGSWGTISPNSW